jgi:hypothetical protein
MRCSVFCRLADDTLYVAHPLMFRPYVESATGRPITVMAGESETHAVLRAAEQLTQEQMERAESALNDEDVRPVLLQNVLEACVLDKCSDCKSRRH